MRKLLNLLESHFELVFEAPADDIINDLKTFVSPEDTPAPLDTIQRKTGSTVIVRVPISKRRDVLRHLLDTLPDAHYDPSGSSSLGKILYRNGTIMIKPSGKEGDKSAGVGNEMELVNILKKMIEEHPNGAVVVFKSHDNEFVIEGVTDVVRSGQITKGRLKGDVQLITKDSKFPISLKKISADVWESADSYFGPTAIKLLKKLITSKKIKLTKLGHKNQEGKDFVKINPEVAVEPTKDEIENVVFGEDIAKLKGAVIIQTFQPQHFLRQDDKIIIECEAIIQKIEDIPQSHLMVWLIRNDRTRNPIGGIPGLRITASVQTRAFGKHGTKENILYVTRNGRELDNPMADEAERFNKEKERKLAARKKIAKPAALTGKRVNIRPKGTPRPKRFTGGLGREKR